MKWRNFERSDENYQQLINEFNITKNMKARKTLVTLRRHNIKLMRYVKRTAKLSNGRKTS